ncbi:GNAT family N-acetyltransferase [Xanthomarina sp. F1114]|uniref:GNAT family N-acetyltransferase n=1 Tax=Xanthomarina sp. F1114 TaxID=2996019 RepID=UPI00225E3CB5|nr:GNAT family N-acetyltransferase [Xanthomarina sp. F1114]MCX7548994.1 GNAT family N-acetyltransferase [Xanthomarina sp. F1114]
MTFSTVTFKLEALKPEDASSLSALMISNGKSFQKYLPKTLEQNLSEAASKIYISNKNKATKNKTEFTFAIKDIETNAVAGLVTLKNIDYQLKQGEFAYCIGKKYSGKGWITQSIKAVSKFALEELGLKNLHILIHKTNLSSIQVAERCGFTWSKTLEKEFVSEKSNVDMELFELQY